MKIVISLSYYLPNISGLTVYAKNLAEGLVKRGYNVNILTSQHDKSLSLKESSMGLTISRIPVTLVIGKGVLMISFFFRAARYVLWADVVNCHLPQFESSILAIYAKLFRKKLIVTYHTDLSGAGFLFVITKLILNISQTVTAILADTIVVQTEDYAKHSPFLSRFMDKLVYIYPPVILPKYRKEIIQDLEDKLSHKSCYRIGVVSRVAKEKGLEYLLAAIPLLEKKLKKDFNIIFAGPTSPIGEEVYVKKMSSLLEKYKGHIIFLGKLTFEEISALYHSLDLLVLPSIDNTEAFGMVQLEAMISGVPVVTTNLPGVSIPVSLSGMGEIVSPKNAEALSDAIYKVLKNRKAYIKKRSKIESLFSLDKSIHNYDILFTSGIPQ